MNRFALFFLLSFLSGAATFAQEPSESQGSEETITNDETVTASEEKQQKTPTSSSDSDFKPSEEISEDFPVPLPSDI